MFVDSRYLLLCRFSLSLLWVFTALTSVFWGSAIGYDVLSRQGINGVFADICVYAGSFADMFFGVWLLLNYRLELCYKLQIIMIVTYSILLSFIDFSFWLHPFGPLTKNIPIIALLLVLMSATYKKAISGNSHNTP